MVAITKALATAVATPVGRPKKRNDGKFPPPKAKGKTRDKVAAYEGVPSRTLGKAMAPGGKFGLVQGISMYTEGAIALSRPGPKTAVCFSLGIRLFRPPAENTFCPTDLYPP